MMNIWEKILFCTDREEIRHSNMNMVHNNKLQKKTFTLVFVLWNQVNYLIIFPSRFFFAAGKLTVWTYGLLPDSDSIRITMCVFIRGWEWREAVEEFSKTVVLVQIPQKAPTLLFITN